MEMPQRRFNKTFKNNVSITQLHYVYINFQSKSCENLLLIQFDTIRITQQNIA